MQRDSGKTPLRHAAGGGYYKCLMVRGAGLAPATVCGAVVVPSLAHSRHGGLTRALRWAARACHCRPLMHVGAKIEDNSCHALSEEETPMSS
jgi:hypothetical protein